jgi:RNA polymerase sigma-70 factor (ECF subfamily)
LICINVDGEIRRYLYMVGREVAMRAADPFRKLYDANQQRIRSLLARLVGPQVAEDLTQTVFAKAAAALPRFRGEAEVSTWLYRIATNVASDWLHSRSAHEAKVTVPFPEASDDDARVAAVEAADVDTSPSPEQELSHKDMRACIRGEIAKLPDVHREIFMLSALGGLSDEEIAQTLGINKANARVRLHRARQQFRNLIASRCDFYQNELSCKPSSPECCPLVPAAHGR